MTRARPTDAERYVLSVPCEFCDAPAGRWCRSHLRGWRVVRTLHQVRYELAAYKRHQRYQVLREMTQDPEVLSAIEDVERGW